MQTTRISKTGRHQAAGKPLLEGDKSSPENKTNLWVCQSEDVVFSFSRHVTSFLFTR